MNPLFLRAFPSRFRAFAARYVCCLSVWTLAAAGYAQQIERLPVPKSAAQSKAERFVREHYKAEFAQHEPEDQLALSHKLYGEIDQFKDDPPTRFVMLLEARELAVDAGDLDAAFAAIDQMGRLFQIDPAEMKASAMTAMVDKSILPPPQLIDKYLHVEDTFLSTGDISMANKAYVLASMLCDQQRDPAIKARVKEEHVALMDGVREQKAVLSAMNKAKVHPEDAEANLVVGKYACFVRELWPEGLPYLSRGSDEKLKALATQELAASDPDATAAVADAWWDYATSATGQPAERARLHAADLYRRVLSTLTGDEKDRAQQRIQQAGLK